MDPDFEVPFRNVNRKIRLRNKTLERYLKHPSVTVKQAARVIPRNIRIYLHSQLRKMNAKHVPRTPMNADMRRRLLVEMQPEVERLSELLQKGLSDWAS